MICCGLEMRLVVHVNQDMNEVEHPNMEEDTELEVSGLCMCVLFHGYKSK